MEVPTALAQLIAVKTCAGLMTPLQRVGTPHTGAPILHPKYRQKWWCCAERPSSGGFPGPNMVANVEERTGPKNTKYQRRTLVKPAIPEPRYSI